MHKIKGTHQAWPWPYLNVHLGVSTEDQATADKRIPLLLELPAAVRFISAEPLLDELTVSRWLHENCDTSTDPAFPCNCKARRKTILNWVIVGGESGKGARPFLTDWAKSLVKECASAGVPCFVKQLGSRPFHHDEHVTGGLSLKDSSGADINEWPPELRVQEFPR